MSRESDFIAELVRRFGTDARGSSLVTGIGSDCAVLAPVKGALPIVTTDTAVDGVHFDLSFMTRADAAYRAIACALSDLAAGGVDPAHAPLVLLSVILPREIDGAGMGELLDGFAGALADAGAVLAGGDTVIASTLAISVTAIGFAPRPMTRIGARIGDAVCVAGYVGGAMEALRILREGGSPGSAGVPPASDAGNAAPGTAAPGNAEFQLGLGTAAPGSAELQLRHLLAYYLRPRPLLALGHRLAAAGATACADISDGLLLDAQRIAEQSGVAMRIALDAIPLAPELFHEDESGRATARRSRDRDAFIRAATGGDDYALVFTVAPENVAAAKQAAREAGVPIARVGEVTDGGARRVIATWDGEAMEIEKRGFEHE
ncbi:thiamine-phosphate kinase [bacterium]|nr:thiamine-phosphate kinase [bacterium]